MKIFLIYILIFLNTKQDIYNCTKDTQHVLYSLFNTIEAFEDDWSDPNSEPLKSLIKNIEIFLNDCLQKNIHIQKYNICLDNALPILSTIKRSIKDYKNKSASGLAEDVLEILITTISIVSDCFKV